MKLEDKIQALQFFWTICNTLFLILGLSILGCALWIFFDHGDLFRDINSDELNTVAGGLLLVGLVVLAVAALGYAAAHRQARVMLLLYMAFLVVLFLGQLFIGLVLLTSREKIEGALDEAVNQTIISYAGSRDLTAAHRLLDKLQRYEKCCGRLGPHDWKKNLHIRNLTNQDVLPCTCFNTSCPWVAGEERPLFGAQTGNSWYQEGCQEKITDWLVDNGLTIIAMEASIIILQVLQFTLAVYLHKAITLRSRIKTSKVLTKPGPDHMDPSLNLSEDQEGFYGEDNQAYSDPEQSFMERTDYPRYPHDQNQDQYSEHLPSGQGYTPMY